VQRVVLASSNPGKVREIHQLLADLDLDVVPQSEYGVLDAEETGLTFVENAILKARNAALHTALPATRPTWRNCLLTWPMSPRSGARRVSSA
jgi:XTP/dITP diphosphohydrolase